MQDIPQNTPNETTRTEQSARTDLWEIDPTAFDGQRCYFSNELNKKDEPVTWQGWRYDVYPIRRTGFDLAGKGATARPTLAVSNLFGIVTRLTADMQSLVGATVVRHVVYAHFLDTVNFTGGNPEANLEQEVVNRWVVEQLSELKAATVTSVLAIPTGIDDSVFLARITLADVCNWTYRFEECGYIGPPVTNEFDKPTADPAKDVCSKRRTDCELHDNPPRIGCSPSINRLPWWIYPRTKLSWRMPLRVRPSNRTAGW